MKSDFSGVYTALVTPFKNGEVDFPSLKKLLRLQMDGRINGLVVNGTTAESPTLKTQEVAKLYEFVRHEIPLNWSESYVAAGPSAVISEHQAAADKIGFQLITLDDPYEPTAPAALVAALKGSA